MNTFVRVRLEEFHEVFKTLSVHGIAPWQKMDLAGTRELVYGCRVNRSGRNFTIRVYTSMEPDGEGRDCGKDAIRVEVFMRICCRACSGIGYNGTDTKNASACEPCRGSGYLIRRVGGSKRVNRVQGWEERLLDRILKWEDSLSVFCPTCSAPMSLRKGSKGKFYGCVQYPHCRGTRSEDKT